MKLLQLLLAFAFSGFCQGQNNILKLKDGQQSPAAKISDVSWIAGHWRGEALGGITEEIWTPPLGNAIMGAFRVIEKDKVTFYELETITEENESLVLKLKHFSSQLTGWEEKNVTVDFKLVKVTKDRVYFDGLTFEKINDNTINTYVLIKGEEIQFSFKRFFSSDIKN